MTRKPRAVGYLAVAALGLLAAAVPTHAGTRTASRELLPNLVALPTVDVYVGGATSHFVTDNDEVVWGCQPIEVSGDSPTPVRCLRFETQAANFGAGPLELHYETEQLASGREVAQRVSFGDGNYRDVYAGTYVFHPAHAHFHYVNFAVASLWRSDARGRRLGTQPIRTGHKAGFCLEDVYQYRGSTQKKYVPPYACYPNRTDSGEVAQVNGVSVGWVDVYDLATPGQYIEISGVPDGFYLLQIALDPDHRLREQTTTDNVVWQRIRLCGDRAEVIGRAKSCASSDPVKP